MARTREQWNAAIDAYATLKGLSSSSVAEWKKLRDCIVTIAIIFESIFELFKADVTKQIDEGHTGSIYWWPQMVKEFQYGDSLTVVDGVVQYATIDASKQVVKQVTVKENPDTIYVKVAKDDGSGNLEELSSPEYTALKNYIEKRRSPGVYFNLYSLQADIVKYLLTFRYDPGYDLPTLLAAIDAVIVAFRDAFPFDAVFYKSQLEAKIQAIEGIKSVILQIDMTLDNGSTIITDLAEKQELPAGYFNWDTVNSTKTPIAEP